MIDRTNELLVICKDLLVKLKLQDKRDRQTGLDWQFNTNPFQSVEEFLKQIEKERNN